MPTFYEFAPTVQDLFQSGFLARILEEGLDSDLAFRRQATEDMIDGRIGSQISIPRTGRKGPVTKALDSMAVNSNLDNGMTPALPPSELYSYNLSSWGDTADIDLLGSTAACADLVKMASRTNGVQAAQSQERLAKMALFAAYDTGNTFSRTDLGANTTTTVYVDDIRGFQFYPVNGVPTAVSVGNPLPCYEMQATAAGVNQTFNVTGATAYPVATASSYPSSGQLDSFGNPISDGISGYLTIVLPGGGVTPINGDAIIAANAPKIVRPSNKPSLNMLTSGDVMTLGLLLDAKARLTSNNVPCYPDGTYHFIHDPNVMRQLFSDQQFLIAYAARAESSVPYQKGQIFELFGITFIPSTECYVQAPTPALGIKVPIRRSILMGAESILQGNYAGTEMYLGTQGLNPIGGMLIVNNVAQIMRPPIDRQLRFLSLTWLWVGSFLCPTDNTATPQIIPTASNASYKRAVVIQTAG